MVKGICGEPKLLEKILKDCKDEYEIKEYTNYEYIAVYSDWDGTIYKEIKYNK